MQPIRYELWDSAPARGDYAPYILHYKPETAKTKASVLLIPGSGYCINPARPVQEGDRVARYLCERGIPVFVLIYRVFPEAGFPAPLLDGRRAMRLVRYKAEEFDIDPTRIATLSYSAGGHLAASLVGYHAPLDGEGADEIALYLSLGFEPYITHESHEARWKAVMHELARRAEKKQ